MSMAKFNELRKKYDTFEYRGFDVERDGANCHITFHFAIPGLSEFDPEWFFWTDDSVEMDKGFLHNLVFNLGMVETISYYKTVCPPKVLVKCGEMTEEQILWWRKLYYNGLGEFMYRNGIRATQEELLRIECVQEPKGTQDKAEKQEKTQKQKKEERQKTDIWESTDDRIVDLQKRFHDTRTYDGCLVPVGGGKDSVVSLELLKGKKITTYSINANSTTQNVIDVCKHKAGEYRVKRTLDPRMLELNRQGFLNGHIPFSAVVAFSTYIAAYLSGNRYIVLSNETSANESTVKDSYVNHQYSKSYEFEKDFDWYMNTITDSDIHYFSFLRPLTELQIAWLFSGFKEYHPVFRSCNVGSKKGVWCANCPKCLFVYIILSPFLSEVELENIFGENLLDKESLDLDFRELMGIEENKPFECVGTRREVAACMKDFVERGKESLLASRYRDLILQCREQITDMLGEWVSEHSLPAEFEEILRKALGK